MVLLNDDGEQSLTAASERADDSFVAASDACRRSGFSSFPAAVPGQKLIPRTHNDYDYSIRRSNELCGVSAETRLPERAFRRPQLRDELAGFIRRVPRGRRGGVSARSERDPLLPADRKAPDQPDLAGSPAVSLWLQEIHDAGSNAQLQSLRLLPGGRSAPVMTLAARIPAEIGCQLQQVFGMAEGW